jgi:hypothetical protein
MILIMLLPGCCVFRKYQPVQTEVVTTIDTLVTVYHDTIYNRVTVNITDTAVIETVTGRVQAYVDTITGKLTATFTGSVYQVPVQTLQKTVYITLTPEKKKKLRFEDKALIAVCLFMIITFLYYRKRK